MTSLSLHTTKRHYYESPGVSIAADPTAPPPVLAISLANVAAAPLAPLPSPVALPPTDVDMARKLRAVKMFVKKHSTELEQDPTEAPTWFSFVLNVFGDPAVFRDVNTGGVGAVDIAYTAAPFKLAPDEALVIAGVMYVLLSADVDDACRPNRVIDPSCTIVYRPIICADVRNSNDAVRTCMRAHFPHTHTHARACFVLKADVRVCKRRAVEQILADV